MTEMDNTVIDIWSIPHFVVPAALGYFVFHRPGWLKFGVALLILYEVVENVWLKDVSWLMTGEPETWANIIGDVTIGIFGLVCGAGLRMLREGRRILRRSRN